jgi:serine/threonine-protein kinase RsbT
MESMLKAGKSETLRVTKSSDVVRARQRARAQAEAIGLRPVQSTKLEAAVSELARNLLEHGGGGRVTVEQVDGDGRVGVRVTFEDRGRGIPDVDQALQDGFSTGGGMGLGLPGAKRLVDEFEIRSRRGEGTRVVIAQWGG